MRHSIGCWSLVTASCLLLLACDRADDRLYGQYTISGHLYKGISDEPHANVPLVLEGVFSDPIAGGEIHELGSTTTDENGFFSFTYDQQYADSRVQFEEDDYVKIGYDQVIGGLIKSLPWNTSLNRKFAQTDHSRALFQVSLDFATTEEDTLYMICDLFSGDSVKAIELPGIGEYNVIEVPLTQASNTSIELNVIIPLEGLGDNSPKRFGIRYGIGLSDLLRSINSDSDPNIPDDYNEFWSEISGFPIVDTIKLEL